MEGVGTLIVLFAFIFITFYLCMHRDNEEEQKKTDEKDDIRTKRAKLKLEQKRKETKAKRDERYKSIIIPMINEYDKEEPFSVSMVFSDLASIGQPVTHLTIFYYLNQEVHNGKLGKFKDDATGEDYFFRY